MIKIPKSLKKYIRQEKTRIRRQVFDFKKQKELIGQLYKKFLEEKPKATASSIKKTG